MRRDEKKLWNQRYLEGSHGSTDPEPLLAVAYNQFLAGNPPGHALDVAGGAGRHALWLAQRGWKVKLIDISEAGIASAQKRAVSGGIQPGLLETEVLDLNTISSLGREQYDLVLVFFFLERRLFPALSFALKPRGFLIYQTYTQEQLRFGGGPSNPCHLLHPEELRRAFPALRILYYRETSQSRATAELIAQKADVQDTFPWGKSRNNPQTR